MDQKQHLDVINLFLKGMIDKDRNLLEKTMTKDAYLYHMTGKKESREEYINDILDGTLNYYDYQIIEDNKNEIKIKLLAKVYGGSKNWWTLVMSIKYIVEDNLLKIKESKVRMG